MGYELCRRRVAVGVIALAGLIGAWGPATAPAWAEEPFLDDLLVAPPGATMEVFGSAADEYDGLSFIENFDLDITVAAEARGAVRVDGSPELLVTAVRLASARQAADVLRALGEPVAAEDMNSGEDELLVELGLDDQHVEPLPSARRGAVARRIVMGDDFGFAEMAWATGRDVVVIAQLGLDGPGEVVPIMHETLDAHRAAFPEVTMPAGTPAGPSWTVVAGVVVAVLAAVGLFLLLAQRGRRTTRVRPPAAAVPQAPGEGSSRARVNW